MSQILKNMEILKLTFGEIYCRIKQFKHYFNSLTGVLNLEI